MNEKQQLTTTNGMSVDITEDEDEDEEEKRRSINFQEMPIQKLLLLFLMKFVSFIYALNISKCVYHWFIC